MNALDTLFARLRDLLPAETVAELRAAYRRDAAADGAASRQRTKERQERQRAAWAAERDTGRELSIDNS
jgi:hypothetical protein